MSQQIIEAEYGILSYYYKVPKGKNIEDAYDYWIKYNTLYIQWGEGGKVEEIEYFEKTEPDYKYPTKVNIYTKDQLKDDGMDWLIDSDDDEVDETICPSDCDCVNCEDEEEAKNK